MCAIALVSASEATRGGRKASQVIEMKGINTERTVTVEEGELGKIYENIASSESEFHYVYKVPLGKTHASYIGAQTAHNNLADSYPSKALRLRTEATSSRTLNPLRVTVRFSRGALNWQVPFETSGVRWAGIYSTSSRK